jgi:hypothetical protein
MLTNELRTKNRRPTHIHRDAAFQAFALAIADSQTFLAIAYIINFGATGQCTVSTYHFRIALNILLLTCTVCFMSTQFIPTYCDSKVAAVLRYLATMVVYGFLVYMFLYQILNAKLLGTQWNIPSKKDASTLLLPIACFLDPDLNKAIYKNLSQSEKDQIGLPSTVFQTPEFWLTAVNIAVFLIALICRVAACCCHRKKHEYWGLDASNRGVSGHPSHYAKYLGFLIILGLATSITSTVRIETHKSWIDKSGWILREDGKNAERAVAGIGQIVPLVAVAGVMFTVLESAYNAHETKGGKPKE